jgi:hypothetical protein
MRIFLLILTLSFALTVPARSQSALRAVPFTTGAWTIHDAEAALDTTGERAVLTLQNGTAFLNDATLTHGVIEVDVQASRRGFAGVAFRAADAATYEKVYVRMHKSGSPDAVQYTPVFNGITSWQLYGPPDYWGTTTFDAAAWTTLRVEVCGQQARVYVGDDVEPALTVLDVRHPVRAGQIGL